MKTRGFYIHKKPNTFLNQNITYDIKRYYFIIYTGVETIHLHIKFKFIKQKYFSFRKLIEIIGKSNFTKVYKGRSSVKDRE